MARILVVPNSSPSTRSIAQLLQGTVTRDLVALSVGLVEPVNIYSQADRACKYGLPFVDLALAIFFLLLLSLSEHMAFWIAYLCASVACIGLLGAYLSAVLGSTSRGIGFAAILTALCAALYGLLVSEDNALVLGSLLLFAILAAAMLVTRRIDWYLAGAAGPGGASAVAPAASVRCRGPHSSLACMPRQRPTGNVAADSSASVHDRRRTVASPDSRGGDMTANGMLRLAPVALAILLGGCAGAGLREHYDKPASTAISPANASPIAQSVAKVAEVREAINNESGFRVLTLSTNGLLSRLALVDKARISVDLQYFIFANDATGKLLAQHLLAAADRGVRVRLLVDDINNKDTKPMLDALDAHDKIEVRIFNPFNTRQPGAISKAAQMLLEFRRLNRRMHNKSFIVDNKVAVIGGRNIADDYFDAGDQHNYRDLDLLAVGPVVPQASKVFDAYWADEAAVPANAFKEARNSQADLAALRTELNRHANSFAESDYVKAAAEELPNGPTADRGGTWFWGPATLVADQPEKIDAGDDRPGLRMAPALGAIIDSAKQEVTIISPYFVPSAAEDQQFMGLLKRGVKLRLVTNSLASTDEPAVQVGYSEHRRLLLGGGAEIFELKPRAGQKQSLTEVGKERAVGLHAKAFVVDARYVFVGSMNMDNRSKLINTEMGFVVDSPALAKAILDYFNVLRQPANAYQVLATGKDKDGDGKGDGNFIRWRTEDNGKEVIYNHEPEASAMRRVEVMMMKLLPIDGLL